MFDTLVKIAKNRDADPELLIELVKKIRPKNPRNVQYAQEKFVDLIFVLEKDEFLLSGFKVYIKKILKNRKFSTLIADLGIISESGFWSEISRRLYNKILPVQPPEIGMEFLMSNVFFNRYDYKWFNSIDAESWDKLFTLLELKPLAVLNNDSFSISELMFSIDLLSLRISGTAMDYSLLKMVPEYASLDSPFISLQRDVSTMIVEFKKQQNVRSCEDIHFKQVKIIIQQCKSYLERALRNKEKFGITFSTTIKLVRLQQQLDRLEMLLDFLVNDKVEDKSFSKTHSFLKEIVKLNASKNNVRAFWRTTSGLVAYQITQHTGKTGENYITESKQEYFKMLKSAAGGGVIVGMLCLFKVLYSQVDTSSFGHAFLYSMNYSLGFVAIYLLHFTLATKQPAMTAATLAKAIKPDNGNSKIDYHNFANLFSRLFRSQFIAFVGNVFFAFPVAMLMVLLWQFLFDDFAVTPQKGAKLLEDINFIESKALLHAAVAGFYLFLSGLISGYYINRNIHEGISKRIQQHPFLKGFLPKRILEKIAKYYDKHIGGITGNIWLGIFLGTTGTIAMFFGLDIDIRHITFAAGNFGLALMGTGFDVSFWDVLIAVLCIGLIGFFNFIVSFVFSLIVALRSRNMRFYELYPIAAAILVRFKHNKRDFFLPPKPIVLAIKENSETDLTDNDTRH